MSGAVRLDRREFDKALIQYAAASNKDFKDIVNKRLYDSALRSVRHAKKANKAIIRRLAKQKKLLWYFAHKIYIPRGWKKLDALEEARKMLLKRIGASGFIKSFFVKMAAKMAPRLNPPGSVTSKSRGSFLGFTSIVIPATTKNPSGQLGMSYEYGKRSHVTSRKTESILMRALQGGINDSARDMMVYVNRKMGKTAKRFSAKGAR